MKKKIFASIASAIMLMSAACVCVSAAETNVSEETTSHEYKIGDATLIQKYISSGYNVDLPLSIYDVTGDGKISVCDATLIQKYCAGMDVQFKNGSYQDCTEEPTESTEG